MGVSEFFKKLLFAKALVFENGSLKIMGTRALIMPGETFVLEQYNLLKKHPDNAKIIQEMAIKQGHTAVDLAKKFFTGGTKDKVDNMLQSVGLMGLGDVRLVNPDISTGKGVFQVRNSLLVSEYKRMGLKSKKPVDIYLAGAIQGAVEGITGIKVECRETKCEALGDPYCEIESNPVKKSKKTMNKIS